VGGEDELRDLDELRRQRAADGAPLGRNAELDIPAEWTQVEARFGEVFALRHRVERRLIPRSLLARERAVHGLQPHARA